MKIAQIAPLIESVPPRLYGGTERIVSYLTEELVALGHDVTMFASGDSITAAKLVPCVPKALRLDASVRDPIPYYMLMLDRVRQRADEFDILHFHIDQFHFPLFRPIAGRTVTTLHGRQDLPDLHPLYVGFEDMPLVSISNAQRAPVINANFAATVYHGVPAGLHRPVTESRGGYLAFLGRISPEKRPDRAISIARAVGIPLKIAAKVDRVDDVYFRTQIEPLLEGAGVEFIGEINDHQKTKFLGEAHALLFPVDWPEPFGLSMIEAMACGTPVWLSVAGRCRRSSRTASRARLSTQWKRQSRRCRARLRSIEKSCISVSNNVFRHANGQGLSRRLPLAACLRGIPSIARRATLNIPSRMTRLLATRGYKLLSQNSTAPLVEAVPRLPSISRQLDPRPGPVAPSSKADRHLLAVKTRGRHSHGGAVAGRYGQVA